MDLIINFTKKTTSYLSQFTYLKKVLFPFYERLGFKEMVHKKTNDNFQLHGFDVLRLITKSLNKNGIKYWVDCGTLLGLIREGNVIKHDMDIDLGILQEDYTEQIDALFYEAGFTPWRTIYLADSNVLVEKTFCLKGIKVDLFLYRLVQDEIISYTADDHPYLVGKYNLQEGEYMAIPNAYTYQKTKQISISGNTFLVPENPSKYLNELYGDWTIKKKHFNYLFDAKSVRINPSLRANIVYHTA